MSALAALLLSVQPTVSAETCSDLSGQNFTGQLPDTITRLRLLSSMYAREESCVVPFTARERERAPLSSAASSTTRGSLVPLQRLHSRRTPTRTPVSPLCLCTAFAAGGTQEFYTEFADGPVPRLCFLDAIHCHSVRCPCSVSLCRLRFALIAARQAAWRESSHRDDAGQHHADADIAAVVRRCPLTSAAACVFSVQSRMFAGTSRSTGSSATSPR